MLRFFKQGKDWFFQTAGSDTANHIGESTLENFLGICAPSEVILVRKQPNDKIYHMTIKDGVIDRVESVVETFISEEVTPSGQHATYLQVARQEQTEFFIEE